MTKRVVESTMSLDDIHEMAHTLWIGHYGYDCPTCKRSMYGSSGSECHAHLLEHLVEEIRKSQEGKAANE